MVGILLAETNAEFVWIVAVMLVVIAVARWALRNRMSRNRPPS
jgi:hypothetical protein